MPVNIQRPLCFTFVALALAFAFGVIPLWSSQKSEIATVDIVPSRHWDPGFNLPPEEQLDGIKLHLDEVIRIAKCDPEFRRGVESTWQVLAASKTSTTEDRLLNPSLDCAQLKIFAHQTMTIPLVLSPGKQIHTAKKSQ